MIESLVDRASLAVSAGITDMRFTAGAVSVSVWNFFASSSVSRRFTHSLAFKESALVFVAHCTNALDRIRNYTE